MKHKSENYSLLVEDWIPVVRTNGKFERVGIRDASTQAGSFRRMAAIQGEERDHEDKY